MAAKMTTMSSIAGLNRALRSLPKEAKAELTDASKDIVGEVADDAKGRASRLGRGWKYLGPTIRAEKSSKPGIKIGGKRRIPGRKGTNQTVGNLLWGTEFGAHRYSQFPPHLGKVGYALFPAVRDHEEETGRRYSEALLDALNKVGRT